MITARMNAKRPVAVHTVSNSTTLQRILLACGSVASLLYLTTDVAGGMRYPGYSFSAQAISELMARGAPSESFVDPLFLFYDVLMLAFAAGVIWQGIGRSGALQVTGFALLMYAAIGFTGPTLFEMYPRGTSGPDNDLPHIVVTGVIVFLTLVAIGSGAFALDRRFRSYSFVTIATLIGLGVLSADYGARLAAGQPTPGFGIVERIMIYSSMLWIALLGVALMRRARQLP